MIEVIDRNRIVGDSSGMVILRIFCHSLGPVDVGSLHQRPRHALEPGHVHHDHVAERLPDRHQRDGRDGRPGVLQPVRCRQSDPGQERVERADLRVEQPQPDGRDRDARRHLRGEEEHPVDRLHLARLLQQEGEHEPADHQARQLECGEPRRVEPGLPQLRILEHGDEVVEPDERAGAEPVPVGEPQDEGEHQRTQHEGHQPDQLR